VIYHALIIITGHCKHCQTPIAVLRDTGLGAAPPVACPNCHQIGNELMLENRMCHYQGGGVTA
jgi:hypothetical protein